MREFFPRLALRAVGAAALAATFLGGLPAARAQEGAAERDYPHGDWTGDCSHCHDPESWTVRVSKDFAHAPSKFPLLGAHRATPCRACHLSLEFLTAPADCADCHRDVHQAEFGPDCARCHTPRNFIDRSRQLADHRASRFPLTGTHVTLECEACHRPQPRGHMTWVNTPVECVSCHEAEYDATTDPAHASAGFPRDCSLCHAATAWGRARFDHRSTAFPLTGAHRTLPCESCHGGGQYAGTPTDCYACHRDDYDGTSDPDHAMAGFPTDCTICHTTSAFEGADFSRHDALYFPIYSGAHRGRWTACTDCHTNPANFTQFDCLACHEPGETDGHHDDVDGYQYASQACYSCHPQGRER